MIAWMSAAVAWAAEPVCPDVDAALAVAEHAAAMADVDRAQEASQAVIEAFACGPEATPEQVARLWLGQAAMLTALGADDAADEALIAAARLSPVTPAAAYGEAMAARHARALAEPTSAVGTLDAFPVPDGYVASIDGVRSPLPSEVPAGPHLLQIGPKRGPMAFAQAVTVSPDTTFVVQTELPLEIERTRRRRPKLTGVGLGVGLAGLSLLVASVPTRNAAVRAYDDEDFGRGDAWVTVNHATLLTGASALAAGGGLVIAARW